MSRVVMGGGELRRFDERTLNGMFAFRHTVFHERLGWDVETHGKLEFDGYDQLDPVYMIAEDDSGAVEGCWRLLPTTGPYMLSNTFPQLLRGEALPRDPHIWELSRFAVDAPAEAETRQAPLNAVTMQMVRTLYDFAVAHRINQFVTVTSVALERLLKRTGLPIHRFGDGKAQKVGRVLTVACWVDIDERFANVVYPQGKSVDRAA